MTSQSIQNKSGTMEAPTNNKINNRLSGIQYLIDQTWGRVIRAQKRKFLSKRTMVLVDPKTGLMECRICGSIHFALKPPIGGTEDIGMPGFKRGSWQCVNGCRKTEND